MPTNKPATTINKNPLKLSLYLLTAVILTLGLSISAQSLLAAWSTPTANPPTGNISPPLDQSINAQVKAGPLGITGDFYVGASNALYVDSANNRLGIGISSPAHNLHIYQDSGNNAELDIQSVAGANNHWAIYNNRADNALRFWQTDNRLTILPNGNVGIGITSPNAKLTVKTTTAFNQFSLVNSAYYTGGWARGADMQFRKSDSSLHRGLAYGIYGGGGTLNGAYFSAIEDDASPWNTAQLFLRSNGNVGIGTTNPGEKLDVSGNIHASGDICTDQGGGKCLSSNTNNIAILSGNLDSGEKIPLPPGYTESQCHWIISSRRDPRVGSYELNEMNSYVDNQRRVRIREFTDSGGYFSTEGTANYLVICIK